MNAKKIPYGHIPAWAKLHEIGLALEKRNGSLPSVRRDSPEWAAWRRWFHDHGMPTSWADRQPGDRMMTVTMLWPPTDEELSDPKQIGHRELKE